MVVLAGARARASDVDSAGTELDYDEITSNTAEITTLVDVGPIIAFTLTTTRKVLLLASVVFLSSTASDAGVAQIADGSNVVQVDTGRYTVPANNNGIRSGDFSRRLILTPGTYTYKIRANFLVSAGTTVIAASATSPTFLMAIDLGPG